MREVRRDGRKAESRQALDVEKDDRLSEVFRLDVVHLLADVGKRSVPGVSSRLDAVGGSVDTRCRGVEGEVGEGVGEAVGSGGAGWEVLNDAEVCEGRDVRPVSVERLDGGIKIRAFPRLSLRRSLPDPPFKNW